MAGGKSLKEQNAWLIRAVMIGHFVAFIWVAASPLRLPSLSQPALLANLEAAAAPGTAAFGLIVIASLLLLGLIPPPLRDRLIHRRWTDPLPGCRAFSEVGPNSSHVDMRVLEAAFGPLPEAGSDQNQLFYKLYRFHREDIGVLDAHGRYLAARDCGTITAILMVTLPWLALWATGDIGRSAIYGLALVAGYLLFSVAAKNYGWRMVQHVLALSSWTQESAKAGPAT